MLPPIPTHNNNITKNKLTSTIVLKYVDFTFDMCRSSLINYIVYGEDVTHYLVINRNTQQMDNAIYGHKSRDLPTQPVASIY